MPDYRLHVLSHTHWDREWYQSFQGFRYRLVYQIDALLDLLESDPEFRVFHLDGQTICLEDYLEIRPEQTERLTHHLRSGRLPVGPWYVMPDELLLSGESLVRNLMRGVEICRQFRVEPMPIGYVSDIFGHCSQFPQIVRSFGWDCVFLHRGITNADDASEMRWRGADGSEVLIIAAYPYSGYNDFLAYRDADTQTRREWLRNKKRLAATPILFALDGNDHMPADRRIPDRLRELAALDPEITVLHSSWSDYLNELKAALADSSRQLPEYAGELRWPCRTGQWAELFYGCASARVPLKQRNDALEWRLTRIAEPLAVMAEQIDQVDLRPWLREAWKWLLSNHPHDSIVGCSVDQVHRDMVYRFDQCDQLADIVAGEGIMTLAESIALPEAADLRYVTVWNPANASKETARLQWEWDQTDYLSRVEAGQRLQLYTLDGAPVPSQVIQCDTDALVWPQMHRITQPTHACMRRDEAWSPHIRLTTLCQAELLPLGWRTFRLGWTDCPEPAPSGMPVTVDECARVLDNGLIQVRLAPNGSMEILDRTTGITFRKLNTLVDDGDCGDGWDHRYPEHDTAVSSADADGWSAQTVDITHRGPLYGAIAVSGMLLLPAELNAARTARQAGRIEAPVCVHVGVHAGSRRVDISVTVQNLARDHRLRTMLPTGRDTADWYADTAFDVVQRCVTLPDTTDWVERARPESPVKNMAFIRDTQGGLAVFTQGLQEIAALDLPDRPLALTLFRAFRQRIGDGWTEDSQLQGAVTCRYALLPIGADTEPLTLWEEMECYKLHPLCVTHRGGERGSTAPSGEPITVSGAVLSAWKPAESKRGQTVRLVNPTDSVAAVCCTPAPTALVQMDESHPQPLYGDALSLSPHQIATLWLQPDSC